MYTKQCKLLRMAAAVAGVVSTGLAQAAIDEIVITANKREQSLQDVPISVSVTSGETIQQSSIVDLIDLQTAVPSLRVNQLQSSAQTNFIIRGYGNGANNPGIEPAVSVYIDGVPRTRSASSLADLPTVERVEVLSGPQSTLFGKNASAGVISVTTMLPDDQFGGMIEATAGNYGSQIIKGTITGPLSDTVSYRLSASDNSADGYATNITTGDSVNSRDRSAIRGQLLIEPSDDLSIRVIADYNEIDEVCCAASSLAYGAAAGVSSALAAARGFATTPVDPWARNLAMNENPTNKLEGKGLSVQFDYDLGYATLTSISSVREQSLKSTFDADFSAALLVDENRVDYAFETFTQELRLTSNGDGDLQWMVGAFHSDEDVETFRNVTFGEDLRTYADFLVQGGFAAAGLSGNLDTVATAMVLGQTIQAEIAATGNVALAALLSPTADPAAVAAYLLGDNITGASLMPSINGLSSSFYAPGTGDVAEKFTMNGVATSVFGQFDYFLSEKLTATLGLNYTEDEKTVVSDVTIVDTFAALPLAGGPFNSLVGLQFFPGFPNYPNTEESGIFKSNDLTHTFRLAYDLNETMTLYAGHSTGFKAVSVNMSVDGRTPGNRAADPEEATNIEVGLKAVFDNGYFNIAYFEQSIEGFQSNVFSGTGFNLENAGKETHKGVEFDGMFALSENLVLGLSGIAIDPVYDSFVNGTCDTTGLAEARYQCAPGERTVDLSGLQPAGVHELSVNANAVYSFVLAGGVEGFFRVEYVHEKDINIADLIPFSLASRGTDNLNASLGFSSANGSWDAMLWGRNLTDHESLISAFPTTASPGSFSGYPNAPRTYGVTLRKNF
ncbi:MAG: TonB-dependent receptor [Porticoccaceae bacterium]